MSLETYLDPLFEELNCPLLTNLYESKEGILYEVFRVEADELWSFVGSRSNKQWLWMVMNTADRKIIAFQLGDRSINTALQLLDKVPQMVKEKATFFTELWISYRCIEQEKHVTAGKEKGYTNHIERFNNTLRQRCSRLVRKALAFSKKLENHIGAIKYFICHYNKQIALQLEHYLKEKPKKIRPSKYDSKLKINENFEQTMKILLSHSNKKKDS